MNINEYTFKQMESISKAYSIRVSEAQRLYLMAMNQFGKENPVVQMLWEQYVSLSEEAQPYSVRFSQMVMQQQIDEQCFTSDEWSSIVD